MKAEDFYTRDEHNAGAEIRLNDALGKQTDCYLKLVGQDSDLWRSVSSTMQREILMNSLADDGKSEVELRAEYLAQAVIETRGFEGEMDEQRLKKLFILAPYVADQADRFMGNRKNFIQPSVKS